MPTICFITRELFPITPGGIGTYIINALFEFKNEEYTIIILTLNINQKQIQTFQRMYAKKLNFSKIHFVDAQKIAAENPNQILKLTLNSEAYTNSYLYYYALIKLASLHSIDLIEFPDCGGSAFITLMAKKVYGMFQDTIVAVRNHSTCEIVNVSELNFGRDDELAILYFLERWSLKNADMRFCISISMNQFYEDFYKMRLDNVSIISHPVRYTRTIMNRSHTLPLNNSEKINILFVGKLQPVKGVDILIKATIKFLEDHQNYNNTKLFLIGHSVDNYKDKYIKLVPNRYKSHVVFYGRCSHDDIVTIAKTCRMAVVPSRIETFPYSALEMNSLCIPLIVNDIPAFRDYVIDGVNGLIFNGTYEDLSNRIGTLFQDDNLYRQIKDKSILPCNNFLEKYKKIVINKTSYLTNRLPAHDAHPLVSVIIPYYNMGNYIEETVSSVLTSTYKNYEIIIVNDGSTDEESKNKLREIEQKYPEICILHKVNGGLGSARNYGIRHSNAKYIYFLDSDDIIVPTALEKFVRALEHNQTIDFVTSFIYMFQGYKTSKQSIGILAPFGIDHYSIGFANMAGGSNIFFRREAVAKYGDYDETLKAYEDWDYAWTIAEHGGEGIVVPELLFHYRIRPDSMLRTIGFLNNYALISYITAKHPKLVREYGIYYLQYYLQKLQKLDYRTAGLMPLIFAQDITNILINARITKKYLRAIPILLKLEFKAFASMPFLVFLKSNLLFFFITCIKIIRKGNFKDR